MIQGITLDSLMKEAEQIQLFLEVVLADNDMEQAVTYGNEMQVYLSRTGFMLSMAKMFLNVKKKNKEDAIHEQFLVNWLERMNAACFHRHEWCRTLVSKGKAEKETYTKSCKEFN